MKIKLIDFGVPEHQRPYRPHGNDAGADVYLPYDCTLQPGEIAKIPLGFGLEIPDGRAGILDLGCLWNREQDWSGAGNRSFSAPEQFVPGEIPGEESDVYAVGRLLAVMLGDDTDGTVRQSGGIRRRNAEKRCGRKDQRQEKWLRKVIAMATCEERKDRIPEIKMLRTLLMVTDDSGRERKRACRAADFYYVRKLYCP